MLRVALLFSEHLRHAPQASAARLAADTMGVPTIIVARTDAKSARLIYQRCGRARPAFIEPNGQTPEGFFRPKEGTGLQHCIARGFAFAEFADLVMGDLASRPQRCARLRRRRPKEVSRQDDGLQLLALAQSRSRMVAYSELQQRSSLRKRRATRQRAISARSAPAISTR